jgi:hypothetical protein
MPRIFYTVIKINKTTKHNTITLELHNKRFNLRICAIAL